MSTFDDIFQQKANSHEAGVPPGVWDKITRKKKKRRFIFFLVALCVLISGIGMLGYFNLYNPKKGNKILSLKNDSQIENKIAGVTVPVLNKAQYSLQKAPGNKNEKDEAYVKQQLPGAGESKAVIETIAGDKEHNNLNKTYASGIKPGTIKEKENNYEKRSNRTGNGKVMAVQTPGILMETHHDNNKISDEIPVKKNSVSIKSKSRAQIKIQEPAPDDIETIANENAFVKKEGDEKVGLIKTEPGENIIQDSSLISKSTYDTSADLSAGKHVSNGIAETKSKSTKKHTSKFPWFVDLNISPVLPVSQYKSPAAFNRTLFFNNSTTEFSGKLTHTDINSSVAFSVSARKAIGRNFSVGAGIRYLQLKEDVLIQGTETKTQYNIVDSLVNTASGHGLISDTIKIITNGNRKINATNSYMFISLPVFFQYNIMHGPSWRLALTAGGLVDVYSRYKNEIDRKAGAELISSSQPGRNKKGISLALFGGIFFGKSITKKIECSLTPTFAWNLINNNNNILNKRIHLAGINVGLSYKIK